ncbi:MAG TPA: uracil-DNA glycosylase [Usitatibacter sp.]|nr:uracil-DNA glycosylase [Usitatibacter sp.]
MDSIRRFIGLLEAGPTDCPCVFNPWRDHDERDLAPRRDAPRKRRDNMAAYLEMRTSSARAMLLGEAPSHRGCRFSGIAFCSEVELRQKADLVARRPLALTSAASASKPMRERSAAVVWDELDRAGCAHRVVLWNAFPWHPYRDAERASASDGPCGPSSNRKPRRTEVEQGRDALAAMRACFTHELRIYAIGKVAEEALARWAEAPCAGYIRHPAQGGESRFREGFRSEVLAHL